VCGRMLACVDIVQSLLTYFVVFLDEFSVLEVGCSRIL